MKCILTVFILVPIAAYSQQQASCPNLEKLDMFCSSVGGLEPDDEGGKYKYYYQRQLHEAACVDLDDPIETRIRRISEMWSSFEHHPQLVCNNLQFDIVNGSVIKYAVARSIDPFIRDAIRYKINLNKVDAAPPGDGRTLLDYVQVHLERSKGSATEKTLKYYYEILRAAGAKHRSELQVPSER